MDHIFFTQSIIGGHVGCFQFLAVMNKAAMNMASQCICGKMKHLCEHVGQKILKDLLEEAMLRAVTFTHLQPRPSCTST